MAKNKNPILMEFHISRKARDLYRFDETLFSLSGNVIFSNFHVVRLFSQKINEKKNLVRFPGQTVKPGQINAMGLIDEILHYVVGLYREEKNSKVIQQALDNLYQTLGRSAVDETLRKFAAEFPAVSLYRGEMGVDSYLEGETEGIPHRQILLEEMLMLWLANMNPAFSPFIELFDDSSLEKETSYLEIIDHLHAFFKAKPVFGPEDQPLVDMLRNPAIIVPHSLPGQLEYIREKWGFLLGRHFYRLLSSLDFIKEEEIAEERRRTLWDHVPAPLYEFTGMEGEPERFSRDLEWMPSLVLLAKNIYVWLHHLSKKYRLSIYHLDQIPDEELDLLAYWGITGLWLIGLWDRSLASKNIKEILGNPDAVASAYSLFDYKIAGDLGGEEAFQNLKERAWRRGIRLASDMVPNHVGIDSRWVIEHPDWFISLDYCPFPSYRFTGPDLSWHGDISIYLEDHYFDQTDAAVVFKQVDRRSGKERYIYHGNDGTRMPWNDTAQLNYLKEEVREAVIQTILGVAKKFPIIRFDAAMTLTKKHYQRLWFPEPGTGGAIPTRAEHGMTRDQFNQFMPEEFWRQVVDRIAQEAPETLLLAEAFWLLEGYFVRTLGMHRVYNSAFMNMLKDEENAKYRTVMKNVLEFNPEILKRFVNFMSNPDEETALFQFGRGDKYFGVCTMMVTLPGLPMFGHGQIEGFAEKYGMEYRHAKWDEQPDGDLIQRHQREIFPLMRRRHLFSDVKDFLLYDFFTSGGYVNEDVFAYSNRFGDERALVIYHNRYATARGWIRSSVAYSVKVEEGQALIQKGLGEGLGLHDQKDTFCIFRDHRTGLEYIRSSKELCEKGLSVELGAYQYQVFIDFREIRDNEWHSYSNLAAYLNGRGVSNLEEAMREVAFQPVQYAFKELFNLDIFRRLMDARLIKLDDQLDQALMNEIDQKIVNLLHEIKQLSGDTGNKMTLAQEIRQKLEAILSLPTLATRYPWSLQTETKKIAEYIKENLTDELSTWGTLLGWLFIHALGKMKGPENFTERSRSWMDEWRLGQIFMNLLRELELEEGASSRSLQLIKLIIRHQQWFELEKTVPNPAYQVLESLLKDNEVHQFIQVNQYHDHLWFNQEAYEELLWWLFLVAMVEISSNPIRSPLEVVKAIERCYGILQKLQEAEKKSDFQVEKLLEILA